MTHRLYYDDAYTATFEAHIVDAIVWNGRPAVLLDLSYFYPTSGGQPHDTGRLTQAGREARVVDVVEDGDQVVHVLDTPLAHGAVIGRIDSARRFDHMQHHTGQHILSQAFVRVANAETVGFHLSDQSVTIDLASMTLSEDVLDAAERLANAIVWENRVVHARQVAEEEAATLPLRKRPPARNGRLRVVDIDGFDLSACGGTHVARTGEVGLIKIVKTERHGEVVRVEFRCGARALADYRSKHEIIRLLTATLTTGYEELPTVVTRLQDESKVLRRQVQQQRAELRRAEAAQLVADAVDVGDARVVCRVYSDRDVSDLRALAAALVEYPSVVAFLGLAGANAQLIFARAEGAPGTMGEVIKSALAALGGARGGGSPTFAQGGGPPADVAAVSDALQAAFENWRQALNPVE